MFRYDGQMTKPKKETAEAKLNREIKQLEREIAALEKEIKQLDTETAKS